MPVGRRWPKRAQRGDFSADCSICGVAWRRSQLTRKADGLLYCPDDVHGRDAVTLNEGNARAAESLRQQPRVYDGGSLTKDTYTDVVDVATVLVTPPTFGNGGGH